MSARTRRGVAIRILNVVDEFTRVAVACHVSRTIGALEVVATLTEAFERHGKPKVIRSDNGREFIATSVISWLAEQKVKTAFIEKGSPQQIRKSNDSTAPCATNYSTGRTSTRCWKLAS